MREGGEMWPGDEGPRESGWAFDVAVIGVTVLVGCWLYKVVVLVHGWASGQ